KQLGDGSDAQSWCEIAPPSGEFRWVFAKFVDREPAAGISRPGDEEERADRRRDAFDEHDSPRSSHDAEDHIAQRTQWAAKGAGSSAIAADSGSRASSKSESGWHSNDGKMSADEKAASGAVDPFQNQLDVIDLQVSQIVADDPATWEFTA